MEEETRTDEESQEYYQMGAAQGINMSAAGSAPCLPLVVPAGRCQGRGSEKGKEERGGIVCEWPKELGGWPAKRVWTLPQTLTGRRRPSLLGSARMRLWMACLQVIASRGWARPWRSWMRLQAPQPYSNPLDALFFLSPTTAHSLVHSLTHLKLQLTFSTFNHFSLPRPTLSSFISSPSDIDLAGITFMRASETGEARKCVSRDVPKTSRVSSDDLPPVASPVTSHYRRKKAKKILDMI